MAFRLRLTLALLLLLTLAPATSAPAAQPVAVPGLPATLPTGPGFDKPVYTAAEFGDHIYLGGEFTYAAATPGGLHAYDPATGALRDDLPLPRLDGGVQVVIGDGADGLFIGGDFLHVNGVERAHLAHIRADGSLNTAWQPQLPSLQSRAEITALAFDGVHLYSALRRSAKRPSESRVELQAHNAVSGDLVWSHGFDNTITSLAIADGTLYVGGSFRKINTVLDYYGLATIQTGSGEIQAWAPQILLDGRSPLIETLVVDGSTLYIGGLFTQIDGINRANLAAFDRANRMLTGWAPQPDRVVMNVQIVEQALWVYGDFKTIAGESRNHLAVFALPVLNLTSVTLPDTVASSLSDKGLVIGAETLTVLVADAVGSLHWSQASYPLTIDRATGMTRNGPRLVTDISRVALLMGNAGQVFISNPDIGVGGGPRPGLARIDRVTGALDDWQPPAELRSAVHIVAGQDQLYVIGQFSDLAPSRYYLRPFDPIRNTLGAWSVETVGIPTDLILVNEELIYLGVEPGADPRNSVFGLVATNIRTGVTRLFGQAEIIGSSNAPAIDKLLAHNGILYVAGHFDAYGFPGDAEEDELLPMAEHLAAFDLATGALLFWNPAFEEQATTASPGITGLVIRDNKLYVSGWFDTVNGHPHSGIVAFDVSNWSLLPWKPGPIVSSSSIASAGDYLYASVFGNQMIRIVAIDPATGMINTEWQLNLSPSGVVYPLVAVSTGLLALGQYDTIAANVQRNSAFFPFTQTSPEQPGDPKPSATPTPTSNPSATPEPSVTATPTPTPTPTREPAPTDGVFRVFLPLFVGK